jgi:hypothetical protein
LRIDTDIRELQLRRTRIPACWRVDRLQICRNVLRIVGIGCENLLVQVDSDSVTMALVDSVIVTGCLHLAFIFQGGWMGQGKGVVSSFWLEPKNHGVGASFRLEPEN